VNGLRLDATEAAGALTHFSGPPEVDSLVLLDQLKRDLFELVHELAQPVMRC
jgi:hypothetical protein